MVLANRAASITVLVTGSSTAAVLLALCGSTAIITSSFIVISWPLGVSAGEEGNATSGSADLSRATTSPGEQGRPQAVREPEHPPGRRQPIRERTRPTQRPRIPDPQAPSDDLNKLPNRRGLSTASISAIR